MEDDQAGHEDEPKRYQGLNYIFSGLVSLAVLIASGIAGHNRADQYANGPNREIAEWTRVVGRWTRGLVFVGILTVAALGMQTFILNNQLGEMRDENRAWIAPRIMRIGDVTSGHEITLSLNYGNIGKEPALKVGRIAEKFGAFSLVWSKPETAMEDFVDAVEAKTSEASCKAMPTERYLGTLYPGPPESYSVQATAPPEWADKILQNQTFFVRGCFHYETMGIERYSGYCFWYNQALPQKGLPDVLRFCPTGNDAY